MKERGKYKWENSNIDLLLSNQVPATSITDKQQGELLN
jgi:hypothetical protein